MRRFDFLKVSRGDNLGDPEYWNRRFEDIDLRIAGAENTLQNVDAVANRVESLALDRLNSVLTPLTAEAIERLTSVSTLFEATSDSPVEIREGTRSFVIPEGKRLSFAALAYLVIFPTGDLSRYMAGRTVSYDRTTGELVVDVMRAVGEGESSDWQIAPMAFVSELESLSEAATSAASATALDRAAVAADKGIVAADRAIVAADKATVANDKGIAGLAAAAAETAAAEAAASAASINPGRLLTKDGNLAGIEDKGTARSNLGLGDAAIKDIATVATLRANSDANTITTDQAWGAAAWVNLGNISGAVEIDLSAGVRFAATLAGNVTISVKNAKSGQSVEMIFSQDATGGRTISWSNQFRFPSGVIPSVKTTPSDWALVYSGVFFSSIMIGAGWRLS